MDTFSIPTPGLWSLTLIVLVIAFLLLRPLTRYASKIKEPPTFWSSLMVLIWGFLYLAYRYLRRFLFEYFGESPNRFYLLLGLALACLIGYAVVWKLLLRRAGKKVEDQIDEIGK